MKTSIFKKMAIAFAAFAAFAGSASAYTEGGIAGTTGTGTKNDPVQVNTFTELKAALENTEINYVELGDVSGEAGYIQLGEEEESGFTQAIKIKGEKHLTLSGTAEFIPDPNYKAVQSFIFFNDFSASLVIDGDGTLKFSAVTSSDVAGTTNVIVANYMFWLYNYGRLTIDSGNLISAVHGFTVAHTAVIYSMSNMADITINGGYLKAESNDGEESYAVEIVDGSFKMYGGTIEKTGKKLTAGDASLYFRTNGAGIYGGTLKSDGKVKAIKLPEAYTTLNLDNFVHGKAVNANNDEVSLEQLSISETVTIVPPEMNVSKTTGGNFSLDSTKGEVAYLSALAEDGFAFVGWVNGDNLNDTLSKGAQFEYDLTNKLNVKVAFADINTVSIADGIIYRVDIEIEEPSNGAPVLASVLKTPGVEVTDYWYKEGVLNAWKESTFGEADWWGYGALLRPKDGSGLSFYTIENTNGVVQCAANVYINGKAATHYNGSSSYCNVGIDLAYEITFLDENGVQIGDVVKVGSGKVPVPPTVNVREDDEYNHYFVRWTPEIVAATGNATYQASGAASVAWTEAKLVGSGTETDPYLIGNAQALRDFAAKVNSGEETSAWAVLMADIDLNPGKTVLNGDGSLYNNGEGLETWTPIGTESNPFAGTFDGNGHTIRGLYFNDESTDYVGLFGYIDKSAKVQNVGVVDSYFKGGSKVGGVVGFNDKGTVSNVYNAGSVSGNDEDVGGVVGFSFNGTVSNVYNAGSVSGAANDVGGVVGGNYGTVSNVYNTGSVSGNDEHVGGVVGFNSKGTVSNVYNAGSVSGADNSVGGVVGGNYSGGTISNVYNTGSVSGGSYVGGVVGSNWSSTVSNVYNTGSVSGVSEVGGVVGMNDNGTVSNVYNTGSVSGNDEHVGGVVGFNSKGTVSNVYNAGSVSGADNSVGGVVGGNYSGGTVSNVYNTGTVSGESHVGGVVGYNDYCTVRNVYNIGSLGGTESFIGGVVGYNYYGDVYNAFSNTAYYVGNAVGYVYGGKTDNVVNKTSAELAELKVASAFSFDDGEENPWTEGTTVSGDGFVTYKFPYLTKFGEKSQPEYSPAIEFAAGNASATVYGATTGVVNIPDEIEVSGDITFNRAFPNLDAEDTYSTIMLPFEPASKPTGVTFYTIGSISEVNGKWKVTAVVENGDIAANTPYLVKVASGTKSITFNGGTFKKTEGEHSVTNGNWKFVGTYEYKAWEEGDEGLGSTYGFAGSAGNNPAIVGKFAKVGAGAYIYPMRAYLEYSAPAVLGRPAANGETRTVASLPSEIDVVITEKDEATGEQTTKVIGSLNTRTGEIKFANDRWFDLQGRYLGSKKPTQKGAYYNNGKKVIVK